MVLSQCVEDYQRSITVQYTENRVMPSELYNVRQVENGFRVVKFDDWFNVIKVHNVWKRTQLSNWRCSCQQGSMSDCRHRIIVRVFQKTRRVSSGWFYNYTHKCWERPILDPVRMMQRQSERAQHDRQRHSQGDC